MHDKWVHPTLIYILHPNVKHLEIYCYFFHVWGHFYFTPEILTILENTKTTVLFVVIKLALSFSLLQCKSKYWFSSTIVSSRFSLGYISLFSVPLSWFIDILVCSPRLFNAGAQIFPFCNSSALIWWLT